MENTLGLEAVFSVAGKLLTLSKPIALVLTRCTNPSFSFTVFTALCVCIHTCPEGLVEPILHLAYTLQCLCPPTTLLLFPEPRSKFSFRGESQMRQNLGCSKRCYRLANPLQGKEQWGQVSCGDDNILFAQHCWFGTPTRYLPWAV